MRTHGEALTARELVEFLDDQSTGEELLRRELEAARQRRIAADLAAAAAKGAPGQRQPWGGVRRVDPAVLVFGDLAEAAANSEEDHRRQHRLWVLWWADTASVALKAIAHDRIVRYSRIAPAGADSLRIGQVHCGIHTLWWGTGLCLPELPSVTALACALERLADQCGFTPGDAGQIRQAHEDVRASGAPGVDEATAYATAITRALRRVRF
ncbi:hypothetical protein KALB_1484 [Kutzneria albida DSM 43870]|uniref:Uncharacterized protein n=2 Tax=Kutzneria TaxID=43356 RepID=W5W1X1_9PSEU|nr:hypothetical protein KALB_1484 [Kutzneria albida DSM 43870]